MKATYYWANPYRQIEPATNDEVGRPIPRGGVLLIAHQLNLEHTMLMCFTGCKKDCKDNSPHLQSMWGFSPSPLIGDPVTFKVRSLTRGIGIGEV